VLIDRSPLLIAVPREALPELDQYRCRCSQPNIGLNAGIPKEETVEGVKEMMGPYLASVGQEALDPVEV
jgi:hypothetical protein